ncbi:MAG: hypothetical protein HY304_05085 [candidate division Zixibacteria bacterium]|nr:hypothetical protein [candidate division Zixibacteria bacterium]
MTVLACATAKGQLSPGELHRSHAFLEGVEHCTQCHDRDRGAMREKCLACHVEMNGRISAGLGLHARPEYRDCQNCHVEHQGRDYNLVWWKDGEQSFDHAFTGYSLRGHHAHTACRTCHRPEFVRDADTLLARHKSLDRTYLGLDTTCLSCHHDEHRGQLAPSCEQCHTFAAWSPAPGFDHGRTQFVLSGRHATTACGKCHRTVHDQAAWGDSAFLAFAGVHHDRCTDCHQDAHSGRFGAACESCHNTQGWSLATAAVFDHAKTRYPLAGRHEQVICGRCHPPGRPKTGLKFENCRDCHKDYHSGEFADRPRGGACEECHSAAGFSPAQFSLELHQSTRFPLREAHLALPCNTCHGERKSRFVGRRGRFKWESTRCQDCHQDVHQGQLATLVGQSGCEGCHSEGAWASISFDHARTGFTLEGAHDQARCASCHHGDSTLAAAARVAFVPLKRDCSSCHRDVHGGQFAVADSVPAVRCDRCHTPANWHAEKFNHNTATDYPLEGAHAKVPCNGCHKPSRRDGELFVSYAIADRACRGCHGTDDVKSGGSVR